MIIAARFFKRALFIFFFPFFFPVWLFFNLFFGYKLSKEIQSIPELVRIKNKMYDFNTLENYNRSVSIYNNKVLLISRSEYEHFLYQKNYLKLRNAQLFLKISFLEFHSSAPSDNWIINVNGFAENKYLNLGKVWFFLKENYNIITYDARGHGDSDPNKITFGHNEKEDLLAIIKYLFINYGNKIKIGIFVSDLGLLTVLHFLYQENNLPFLKKIKFVISESPIIDLDYFFRELIIKKYDNFHVFFVFYGLWFFSYFFYDFNFMDNNLFFKEKNTFFRSLKKLPFFFIKSNSDTFSSSEKLLFFYKKKIQFENEKRSKIFFFENVTFSKIIFSHHNFLSKKIIEFANENIH